jgi:hypothetical protein
MGSREEKGGATRIDWRLMVSQEVCYSICDFKRSMSGFMVL